jgi:hypothetical protein
MEFLSVCRQLVNSTLESLTNSLSELEIAMTTIDATLLVDLDGANSVSDHLNHQFPAPFFSFFDPGSTIQHREVKFDMRNMDDTWRMACHVRKDFEQDTRLVLSCFALFDEDEEIGGLEGSTRHLEHVITELLPQIGVTLR